MGLLVASCVDFRVSVSLPRFGGWRVEIWARGGGKSEFQSRCRDLGVGEFLGAVLPLMVAEFQSRCRDLGVGEIRAFLDATKSDPWFQSRCRDLGVGEFHNGGKLVHLTLVSVSLPRFGGWRVTAMGSASAMVLVSVSLPRFGGWRAPL